MPEGIGMNGLHINELQVTSNENYVKQTSTSVHQPTLAYGKTAYNFVQTFCNHF